MSDRLSAKELDRFFAKFEGSDGCWIWTAGRVRGGYGQFRLHGKVELAHRVMFAAVGGAWPKPGIVIRHTCDNPSCVRPDHLLAGTHADNVADKVARNRQAKGEGHGRANLTDAEAIEIRRLYATGEYTQLQLAKRFGVSQMNISHIVRGETWAHLGGPIKPRRNRRRNRKRFSAGEVQEIRRLYGTGAYTQLQIGAVFGVSQMTISRIVRGETWAHLPFVLDTNAGD